MRCPRCAQNKVQKRTRNHPVHTQTHLLGRATVHVLLFDCICLRHHMIQVAPRKSSNRKRKHNKDIAAAVDERTTCKGRRKKLNRQKAESVVERPGKNFVGQCGTVRVYGSANRNRGLGGGANGLRPDSLLCVTVVYILLFLLSPPPPD